MVVGCLMVSCGVQLSVIAVCEKCVHINVYLCSHREHIMTSFDHQNDRLQSFWEFNRGHVGVDLQLVYRISCR